MTVSRRNILLQGCVIGVGVIAANTPGIVALAQAQVPLRRSLEGMAWNDPIISAYRDAVGQMKQKPVGDKFNWVTLARIHGFDPNNYHFCPHGNWYFLPWHRAYTLMYERIVRQLTGFNAFAMPYWDWTANPLMPEVFLQAKTPDGKANPLFVSDPGFMRTWPANTPMPSDQVGPGVLQQILDATPYEAFGTSRPQGQNSLDQSWIVDQNGGVQGVLEGNSHNNVHNNIGGWMPSAISPRDPIFFMHHGNIDRIWALWNVHNQNSNDPLWTDMPFTNNFYNVDGTPYSPKVSDLFVPETLGYTYGLTSAVAGANPAVVALGEKLKTIYGMPRLENVSGVKTYMAQNDKQQKATPEKFLELPVEVDAAMMTAVARRKPLDSGLELLDYAKTREQAASGPRALAFVREVTTTQARDTAYRVFIDCNYLSAGTSTSDPHYVGTFAILDHGGHDGKHGKPSFALDLTRAIQRIHGGAEAPPSRVRLQILPISNKPKGKAGTASPSRVEVAFVTT